MTKMKPFLIVAQAVSLWNQTRTGWKTCATMFLLPLLFAQAAYGGINAKLLEAANAGDATEVERLLEKGADVNAKAKDGMTALMAAALFDHTEIAEALIGAGADVNVKAEEGLTALMLAAAYGHIKTVRILIDAGARVDAETQKSTTAVMLAAYGNQPEFVNILKQAEAKASAAP